ncbi:DUF1800 family protein [Brevifollis gellanilyticus]|uniref:CHRD domain-containing protein n=1 Tax=Brevifollis gellanilyticus TaxID=748831 RepID=A0A512MD57_9BACT|nr:DUF1800 family protein [Brevifollis gellanilyticus]GEP44642.1 hypothetical protein BGE01nite_39330 [Brevifollis gellanilyticus]
MVSRIRLLFALPAALLLLGFTVPAAQAQIVDNYSTGPGAGSPDGLDDLWQSVYNGWGLAPGGDADFDGCINSDECIAGSNPWKANDCLKVGNMVIGGTNIIMYFEAKKGKEYQVWESTSPGGPLPGEPGSLWVEKTGVSKIAAATATDSLVFPKPAGASRFYRIESKDHDADGDGVSDWAEDKLGSNPNLPASPGNASGGAASDLETMKSLLSLTATPGVTEAYEKEGTNATIQLQRSYGSMPLTVNLSGAAGAEGTTKGSASAGDFIFKNLAGVTTNSVTLPANQGVSAPYTVARVGAALDSTEEVPEALKVKVALPGVPEGLAGPEATVSLKDADPNNTANRKLYVAFLGREESVISTASGYATALVDGDNSRASIGIVFNNLSSEQNTAYIRVGNDLEILPLPLGQVAGANWNIRAAQTELTDQAMLDALKNGELYVSITTANNPVREIFGYFNRATGSEVFDNGRSDLEEPALGSATWPVPTGDALEREIWRFMSQATFGGTTELYTQIRALCDQKISTGGTYLDGLEAWLDKQIDPVQTPSINLRKLVMAADMEEFLLRGNKPINYSNNSQYNGATYGVSYVNGMPMANTTVNTNANNATYPQYSNNRREWWTLVTQAPDQLRQRMAHALHQICVISERDATVAAWHYGAANYWDMLAEGAFGKYRTLLENVSLSPMMGVYLTSVANRATYESSPGSGLFISPDENYAREIMQLFSIGLVLRHPDGSLQLSSEGLPIATYDNNDIMELARVFTGFSFGARHGTVRAQVYSSPGGTTTSDQRISPSVYLNGTNNNIWFGRDNGHLYWQASWIYPMKVMGRIGTTVYHDFAAKTLLNGKHGSLSLAAKTVNNGSPFTPAADSTTHDWAYADVKLAHDCLAGDAASPTYGNGTESSPGHTNTPVNISRWLIQRLVTSNPSAGYIYRVQKAYRDNNGLLGPVAKAILLDHEARSLAIADSLISHGKIKEPLVHMTQMLRQFRAYSGASVNVLRDMDLPFSSTDAPMTSGYEAAEVAKFTTANVSAPSKPAGWPAGPFRFRIDSTRSSLVQSPQDAPTVFNWFYPDFQPAGRFAQNGLFAPELQIATEAAEVAKVNFLYGYTWMNLAGMSTTPGVSGANFIFSNAAATPAARFSTNGGSSFLGWPASITLDSTNWNTGVTITMVPVNNGQFSQMASTNIRYSLSGNAVGYSGTATFATPVTFNENEVLNESLVVTHSSGNAWVAEGIYNDTFTVKLSCPPMAGATVTVNTGAQNGEVTVTPAVLNFNSTNWNTPQVVTVDAVNDSDAEDAGTGNDIVSLLVSSTAANWSGLPATTVPVGVTDNDGGADVLIRQTVGTTATLDGVTNVVETTSTSGANTDNYSIVLTKAPTANVVVNIVIAGTQLSVNTTPTGTTFSNTTTTRTFTTANWNVAQNVTVRGNDDSTTELSPHTGGLTHTITTTAGGYTAGLPLQPIVGNITDNDAAIVLAHTDGETRVEERGITDTITVSLRNGTVPTQNVSVVLSSTAVRFSVPEVIFTAANYNVPQTVTVTALDDNIVDGLHAGSIIGYSSTSGTTYVGSVSATLPVTVIDNDDSRLRVIESNGSTVVGEDGLTDTYDLVLSRVPAAGSTTTVTLTAANGAVVSPTTPVVFTDANWNIPQTITVSTSNDGSAEARAIGSVTHTMVSTDPVYNKANAPVVVVTIDDNDPPLNVTLTNFATNVREAGTVGTGGTPNISDTFTVTLGRAPGSTTPVTVSMSYGPQFTVTPSTLNFTSSNYTAAQTVTVTAVDDAVSEPVLQQAPITFAITSGDAYFNGAANPPVMVYITDNDTPGVSIVESGDITQTTEGNATQDNYTVVLTQAPAANVDIVVNGGSQSLLSKSGTPTLSSVTLNFTTANWSTAQTVNVLAVNDTIGESGRMLAPITHTISTSDPNYSGMVLPSVNNVITDNDPTAAAYLVRVIESGGTSVTENGSTATDTFTVALGLQPTSDVTVTFTSPDNQLSLVGLNSVTFTPTSGQAAANGTSGWNVAQTLTVRANDDKIIEPFLHWGTLSATVTTTSPNYAGVTTIPVALVSSLRDNDGPSVIVAPSGGSTNVTEVGTTTDTYSVALSQAPTSNVTVSITPDAQVTASASSLTFTPANWANPQTVTLTAVNDTDAEAASHPGIITHMATSGDSLFNGLSVASVTANVWDDDSPGITVTESGGSTTITEGNNTGDTIQIKLNTQPAPGEVVTITLHPPTYLVPVPQHGMAVGYFTNDYGGSSERDNIVFDYTESIVLYRDTFYNSLTAAFGGTIPVNLATSTVPADIAKIQNAHWAASKITVDKLDLWFSNGSMKANWPVLVEPNVAPPTPLPAFNPRQAIIDAVYRHNGGTNSPSTTRYMVVSPFNAQNPRGSTTLDNEICDRIRWAAYMCTVGSTAFASH